MFYYGSINLTATDVFKGIDIGIGTWAWGDGVIWNYGSGYDKNDLRKSLDFAVSSGQAFFDTAEVYSFGKAESFLGEFMREGADQVRIVTKFWPMPWRFTRKDLLKALESSLRRLGRDSVELYQIHNPFSPVNQTVWLDGMVEAYEMGMIKGVGVSNFNSKLMEFSYDYLAKRNIQLASNQVEYHLLNRRIENNGILKSANDHGIKIISYSPLAKGLLTGKYTPEKPIPGLRRFQYGKKRCSA